MRPFTVIQNNRFLFTVYARSIEQVRALVAARLADTTGVVIVENCFPKGSNSFVELPR